MSIIDQLKGVSSLNQDSRVWGVNFYLVVEEIDEANQFLVGRRMQGRGLVGKPLRVGLNPKFNHPSRPTWQQMRTPAHKCYVQPGGVYYVQNADMSAPGVFSAKWLNRMCTDYTQAMVLRVLGSVDKPMTTGGATMRWGNCLFPESLEAFAEAKRVNEYLAQRLAKQARAGNLSGTGIALQVVEKATGATAMASHTLRAADLQGGDDPAYLAQVLLGSPALSAFLLALGEQGVWTNPAYEVRGLHYNRFLFSAFRMAKQNDSAWHAGGRQFWRDSHAMFQHVTSSDGGKKFWSLQSMAPVSYSTVWMPHANPSDPENLDWRAVKDLVAADKAKGVDVA